MKLGHKLKTLRTAKMLEPIVLAEKLGISESTYRRYERDQSEPSVTILLKIAQVFKLKVGDLLEEDIVSLLPWPNNQEKALPDYQRQIAILSDTITVLNDQLKKKSLSD